MQPGYTAEMDFSLQPKCKELNFSSLEAHMGKIPQGDTKCRRIYQSHPEEMLHPIALFLITL